MSWATSPSSPTPHHLLIRPSDYESIKELTYWLAQRRSQWLLQIPLTSRHWILTWACGDTSHSNHSKDKKALLFVYRQGHFNEHARFQGSLSHGLKKKNVVLANMYFITRQVSMIQFTEFFHPASWESQANLSSYKSTYLKMKHTKKLRWLQTGWGRCCANMMTTLHILTTHVRKSCRASAEEAEAGLALGLASNSVYPACEL